MRNLGAARLSRTTDESTSIDRQREQIALTARLRGGMLVHVATDTDISGQISPFERDDLGPWLTDPEKIAKWDCLIIPKLDRLTRSLRDFDEIVEWLDRNGKTLISVSESLDLSTPTGRMSANLLAMFAQFERERIAERRRERAADDRAKGWWGGGGVPYGMRPVRDGDHWILEIDPVTYSRLESIAESLISGQSATSVARHLDAVKVPTPRGGKGWRQNTIRDIFANDRCPLEPDLLGRVTDALSTTKQPWTKRADAALLLNIASCVCGKPLHSKRYVSKGHLYEYYDCSGKCGSRRIPMHELEASVGDFMTDESGYGLVPVYKRVIARGRSNVAQITLVERRLRQIALDGDIGEISDLRVERDRLLAQRAQPDIEDYEDTCMKVCDYWPTLDRQRRRMFLIEAGVRVHHARRYAGNGVSCVIDAPRQSPDFGPKFILV